MYDRGAVLISTIRHRPRTAVRLGKGIPPKGYLRPGDMPGPLETDLSKGTGSFFGRKSGGLSQGNVERYQG